MDKRGVKDGKLVENDMVLLGYGEVLVMESEGKVGNGENGDGEVNLVRSRVGMGGRGGRLENLVDEGMMEVGWEGWRGEDMIGLGVFRG